MPGRLNVYPPDSAAMVRLLEDGTTYRIGRSSECEMRIDHPSVSRFHAELERRDSLWQLHDTGSKNGLRVDGHLVLQAEFPKSGWFSIGDVHCSFELLDAAQAVGVSGSGLTGNHYTGPPAVAASPTPPISPRLLRLMRLRQLRRIQGREALAASLAPAAAQQAFAARMTAYQAIASARPRMASLLAAGSLLRRES